MRKYAKKTVSALIVLGGMAAVLLFFWLLRSYFSPFVCVLLCLLTALFPLIHLLVKIVRSPRLAVFCNMVGGALAVPMLYLLIYSAAIGFLGFGYTLFLGDLSPWAHRLLLLVTLVLFATTVLCGMLNARRVKVVRYDVQTDISKPVKIAFFSDLHLGAFSPVPHVQKIVTKIKKEEPDLVLFGGDLLDLDVPKGTKKEETARLLSALDGVIACEGNHDLYRRNDPAQSAFLKQAKVRMLKDEVYKDEKSGLCILGRQSCKAQRSKIDALSCKKIDILLDHDPRHAKEAIEAGIPLVLCGHTHKGQTFPGNILRRLTTPYFYGKYAVKEGNVITTAGCGSTGLGVRFLITNEIVIINLSPRQ